CANLARGVTFERKKRVVAVHAAAVVDDTDQRNPAAPDDDFDLSRTGIDAVLDQFFHDGSGPLHDFPRRYLAGKNLGQKSDAAHFISNLDFGFWIAKEIANLRRDMLLHVRLFVKSPTDAQK